MTEHVRCPGGLPTWILDGATTEGEMTYTESRQRSRPSMAPRKGILRAEREHPLANRATASWQTWG